MLVVLGWIMINLLWRIKMEQLVYAFVAVNVHLVRHQSAVFVVTIVLQKSVALSHNVRIWQTNVYRRSIHHSLAVMVSIWVFSIIRAIDCGAMVRAIMVSFLRIYLILENVNHVVVVFLIPNTPPFLCNTAYRTNKHRISLR